MTDSEDHRGPLIMLSSSLATLALINHRTKHIWPLWLYLVASSPPVQPAVAPLPASAPPLHSAQASAFPS